MKPYHPKRRARYLDNVSLFLLVFGVVLSVGIAFCAPAPPVPAPTIRPDPAQSPQGPVCPPPRALKLPAERLAWCDSPWTIEPDPRLVLMLTRTVIHEAGLRSPHDADGIVFVILDRARKMNIEPIEALRAYSPAVFAFRRRDSSGWKVRVTPDATMPEGWRSQARWDEIGAPGVRMVYDRVHGLLTGRVTPVCTPHHWGAQRLRRESSGWREVECSAGGDRPALNAYWIVPRGRRSRTR